MSPEHPEDPTAGQPPDEGARDDSASPGDASFDDILSELTSSGGPDQPEQTNAGQDPSETSDIPGRGTLFLNQQELDRQIHAQAQQRLRPEVESLLAGVPPEIEKEPIEDEGLFKALMGSDYIPGQKSAQPPPLEPPPEGYSLLFEQSEIDALAPEGQLHHTLSEEELLSADAPKIEKEPIDDPALLKALMGEEPGPAKAEAPSPEPEPSTGVTEATDAAQEERGLLTQAQLDALLDRQSEAPPPSQEGLMDAPLPVVEREEITDPQLISALMGPDFNAAPEEQPSVANAEREPAEAAPASQEDVDSLISDIDTEPEVPAVDSESSEDLVAAEAAADEFSKIAAETDAEPEIAPEEPVVVEAAGQGVAGYSPEELDAEDVDTLIAKLNQPLDEAGAEIPAVQSSQEPSGRAEEDLQPAGIEIPSTEIEAEPTALDDTATAEEAADEPVLIGPNAEEPLVENDMEERLDLQKDEDVPIVHVADEMEAVVAPANATTEEEVGSENIAAGASEEESYLLSQSLLDKHVNEAREAAEQPTESQPAEKSKSQPSAPVETPPAASEPVQASSPEPVVAATKAASSSEPAPVTVDIAATVNIAEETTAEQAGDVSSKTPFQHIDFSKIAKAAKENTVRATATVAAGLLVALATLVFLYQNRLRPVDDLMLTATMHADDLNRATSRARNFIDSSAYSEAVEILRPAVENAPPSTLRTDAEYLLLDAEVHTLPATLKGHQGDRIHEAIDRLVEFAVLHPRAPEALYWKAKIYERENNQLAARSVYRQILTDFGNAANLDETLVAAAQLELSYDNPTKAAEYLERLIEEFPGSKLVPQARLLRGDAFVAVGDAETARIAYVRSVEAYSGTKIEADAFERLGRLAFDTGNYRDAIRELETRLATATTVEGNDSVYILLARSYRYAGRPRDARDILNELLRFFPESNITPIAYVELSRALHDLGMRNEALRIATETVQRYPDNAAVLRNEGELLADSGDVIAAGRALMAANAAGADDPELLLSAGRLFKEAGYLDDARDAFDRVSIGYPNTSQAIEGRIEWAKVVYEQGEITVAFQRLEDMRLLTDAQPQHILVLAALGELYKDIGLDDRAANMFARIAATTSEPEMLARAAVILMQAQELDEGLAVASRVSTAQLSDPTAYLFLMEQGEALLRADARAGLEKMEQAYDSYPLERSAEGDQQLLEANLVTGRAARARAIVAELQARVTNNRAEPRRLEVAATTWGDFLFARRDYRAAADAYAVALETIFDNMAEEQESVLRSLTPNQQWVIFQRANALFALSDFEGSISLYEKLGDSRSRWAEEALAKAASARIEQRLRGVRVPEQRDSG